MSDRVVVSDSLASQDLKLGLGDNLADDMSASLGRSLSGKDPGVVMADQWSASPLFTTGVVSADVSSASHHQLGGDVSSSSSSCLAEMNGIRVSSQAPGSRVSNNRKISGPGGVTGNELAKLLASILSWESPPTKCPEFTFCWSTAAARTNLEILRGYDMDISWALLSQPFSTLTMGSEFRPIYILDPLCRYHPLWSRVREWLTTGIEYPLDVLPERDQLEDLHANFVHGNHQSAVYNTTRLVEMLKEEVSHGWQLILPQEAVLELDNAVLAPLGLVEQDTINEMGEITQKWKLIHDQSFNVIKGTLRVVNSACDPRI
jgi:hypothetical protein